MLTNMLPTFLVLFSCFIVDTATCVCQEETVKTLLEEIKDLKRQVHSLQHGQRMIEKQNDDLRSTIEHLVDGTSVTDNKSKRHLTITSLGHRKVAFTASLNNHATNLGSRQTIVFDHVITNEGNVYSPITGVFTAPHNGTYFFTTVIMSHSGDYFEAELTLNGNTLVKTYSKDDAFEQGVNSVVLTLKEGDMVWVRKHGIDGSKVYGFDWSTFSGFLISDL